MAKVLCNCRLFQEIDRFHARPALYRGDWFMRYTYTPEHSTYIFSTKKNQINTFFVLYNVYYQPIRMSTVDSWSAW